jgi:membrane protein
VQMLAGPPGARTIEALLEGSRNTTHGVIATAAGLITLLFGASGVLIELREALNTIWEVPTPDHRGMRKIQNFIQARLFSFAMVLAMGFLLIVSLAVSAWIAVLGAVSASVLPAHEAVLHLLNSLISLLVITLLFAAIYKIMPEGRIEWRDAVRGGAVASLLFNIGKLLLAIYLGKASFASTYGAAASFVVLIIWVYYSAQIFFFGAEITRTLGSRGATSLDPDPGAITPDTALGNVRLPEEPKVRTRSAGP